jgi:hypothetical protein
MDRLTGRLKHNAYDFEGLVLTGCFLCAFGLSSLQVSRDGPAA